MSVRAKCRKLLERPTRPVGEWIEALEPLGDEERRIARYAKTTKGTSLLGHFLLPAGFGLCVRPVTDLGLYDSQPIFLVMIIVAVHYATHYLLRWFMRARGREYRVRWIRWFNVPALIFGPLILFFLFSRAELEPLTRVYVGASLGFSSFFLIAVPAIIVSFETDRRIGSVLLPLLKDLVERYGKDLEATLTIDPVPIFNRVHATKRGKKGSRKWYETLFASIEATLEGKLRLRWRVSAFGMRTTREAGTAKHRRVDITYKTYDSFFLKHWFPAVSYQPTKEPGESQEKHYRLHLDEEDGEWMVGVGWETSDRHPDSTPAIGRIVSKNVDAALEQIRRISLR